MQRWMNEWMFSCFFEGDEGSGGGGAAGSGGAKGDGENKGGDGAGEEKFDAAYVKTLRQEAAANRKKATDLEAKLKARDDADLTETEKLKKQAAEATEKATQAEERSRQRVARAEVLTEATKAKIVDPDAAYRLIRDDLEFGDDGEPKNVVALIKQLAKERPYLVQKAAGSADGGAGAGGTAAKSGMNDFIRKSTGRG